MRLRLVEYSATTIEERDDTTEEECRRYLDDPRITWIHVQGEPGPATLQHLGETFGLHPLALEDITNSGQRPKAEVYDQQLFAIASLPKVGNGGFLVEQVSVFLGQGFVVSFCTGPLDPFDSVRRRLRAKSGRLRTSKADYLFYCLVDVVIDEGFPVLEEFGVRLEELERELLASPSRKTLNRIHGHKRELLLLRKMLWPHREVAAGLMRDEQKLFAETTRVYLRDLHDHAIQILDLVELYREMTTSMLDVYLSSVSNKMNDVMKILTIIATIFIPMTFLAGVYGMNFDRTTGPLAMPELGWAWGYPVFWAVTLSIGIGMLVLFRVRKWI